jgi:3D (Asp-Asp-Asp) domain-containing protein
MNMQEHEYKARDKTVRQVDRDGLREKKLHSEEENQSAGREEKHKFSRKKQEDVDFGNIRSPTDSEDMETEQREVTDLPSSVFRTKSARTQTRSHKAYLDSVTESRSERKKKMAEACMQKERKNKGGSAKKAASVAVGTGTALVREKLSEEEDENSAGAELQEMKSASKRLLRTSIYAKHRLNRKSGRSARLRTGAADETVKSRLMFQSAAENEKARRSVKDAEQEKKNALQKMFQKKRYQKQYQAAKEGKKTKDAAIVMAQNFTGKVKAAVKMLAAKRNGMLAGMGVILLVFLLIATSLSSCGAMFEGVATAIISTSYSAEDEDIYAAENAYKALETALNEQINQMETKHPEYDEYDYQIDEIGHNPYYLISYLTVKNGGFTYKQVADEVEEIFKEQYKLYTESIQETVTETKTVKVGESLGQVVTSGYCNCVICCGKWSGGPTASGPYPTENHTIAVDSANPFVPIGTHVVMNGVEYVVEDTGSFDKYGVQFDVYYADHSSASAHGHQTWEAYIADSNGSKEVEITTTKEVNRLNVTLTNKGLDAVLRSRMTEKEQEQYDLYNTYYGNRDYLFDTNTLLYTGSGADGFGYDIPSEALSDKKFANMIQEAEKYLGYPYVWGGASPSTSFDCSGFVCWVINNCGNGWNVGRLTAEGLRSACSYVSPSEAKPGDLIFFQKTYNTSGASHVGIYVGNGMMIHCGNPIKYTSIETSYWQEHFLAFGRIH